MRSVGLIFDFDSQPVAEIRGPNRDFSEPLLRRDAVFDGVFHDRLEEQRGHPSVADAVVDRRLDGEAFVSEARPLDREIRTGVFDLIHHRCVMWVMKEVSVEVGEV